MAFTTHLGVYELTVMFFGLTNSLATFQAMMNKILRDFINTGEVAAFMDDILIETEKKEKHDEIVEKVLRRMEKNNLYIKVEKCIWKVREIDFIGLVMGSGGNKDAGKESSRSTRMAKTKNSQRSAEVLGTSKLLQAICQRFC